MTAPSGRDPSRANQSGFSLIEIMVVLLLIGLAMSVVMLSFTGTDYDEILRKKAQRFQVVFDMASDYAVLNQMQIGVRVEPEKRRYFFMYLNDQDKWRPLDGDKIFAEQQLEDEYYLELELDDLPWQEEESLFDSGIFDETLSVSEDRTNIGEEEEEEPEPPQIFIFSSGEITPFSLTFKFEPDFGNAQPVYYKVNAIDFTPLELDGPLDAL